MFGFEVTQAITILATVIAQTVNEEEAALLSAVFTQLGDTLATLAVAKTMEEDKSKSPSNQYYDEDITIN